VGDNLFQFICNDGDKLRMRKFKLKERNGTLIFLEWVKGCIAFIENLFM
jgi:hypothetical protein